jgi:hypothetical protein
MAHLHIERYDQSFPDTVLGGEDLIVEDYDAILGLYSDQGGTLGSGISFGEINSTTHQLTNKWSIVRSTSGASGDNQLRFAFGTNPSYGSNPSRLTLDDTGNVGIGTNLPDSLLHVSASTSGDAIMHLEADTDNNNEDDQPAILFSQDGGAIKGAVGFDRGGNDLRIMAFSTNGTNNIGFFTGPEVDITEKMRIASNGYVGIGTETPTNKLEIEGPQGPGSIARINQTGAQGWSGLRLDRNGTEEWFIGMAPAGDLVFRRSDSSNPMIIDDSGDVGIGKSPSSAALEVKPDPGKLAIKAEGDIHVDGAIAGGTFPVPIYNSGWFTFTPSECNDFGGKNCDRLLDPGLPPAEYDKDNFVVDLWAKTSSGVIYQVVTWRDDPRGGAICYVQPENTIWVRSFDENVFTYRVRVWYIR